jgi:hypothetical protein
MNLCLENVLVPVPTTNVQQPVKSVRCLSVARQKNYICCITNFNVTY